MELDTQTKPTGFADRGRLIGNDALRQIHAFVGEAISGLADGTWRNLEEFGVEVPASVDVDLYVELPSRSAGELALALDAVDFAWRIALVVAEIDEAELPPSSGWTNLDELVPIEHCGLEVEAIEIGSIKAWLKKRGVNYDRALATFSVLVSVGGLYLPSDILFGQVEPSSKDVISQVLVLREPGPEADKVLQDQHPGLPVGCQTRAKITLPDGTTITVNLPMSALPEGS